MVHKGILLLYLLSDPYKAKSLINVRDELPFGCSSNENQSLCTCVILTQDMQVLSLLLCVFSMGFQCTLVLERNYLKYSLHSWTHANKL
jgi:hypothetical protein